MRGGVRFSDVKIIRHIKIHVRESAAIDGRRHRLAIDVELHRLRIEIDCEGDMNPLAEIRVDNLRLGVRLKRAAQKKHIVIPVHIQSKFVSAVSAGPEFPPLLSKTGNSTGMDAGLIQTQ